MKLDVKHLLVTHCIKPLLPKKLNEKWLSVAGHSHHYVLLNMTNVASYMRFIYIIRGWYWWEINYFFVNWSNSGKELQKVNIKTDLLKYQLKHSLCFSTRSMFLVWLRNATFAYHFAGPLEIVSDDLSRNILQIPARCYMICCTLWTHRGTYQRTERNRLFQICVSANDAPTGAWGSLLGWSYDLGLTLALTSGCAGGVQRWGRAGERYPIPGTLTWMVGASWFWLQHVDNSGVWNDKWKSSPPAKIYWPSPGHLGCQVVYAWVISTTTSRFCVVNCLWAYIYSLPGNYFHVLEIHWFIMPSL